MFLFKKFLAVTAFSIISLPFSSNLFAANIYVDKTLSTSCSAGNYSTTSRSCNGSDGKAYNTIQKAVNNMSTSDDIYIRGGTYFENVLINGDTPGGKANDYASMQSYPGEWAIIDGQNKQDYTVGKNANGRDDGNDLAYWKFERLEITGGTNGRDGGAGLYVSGGPFIVRYCYIHDNQASGFGENPGGIVGYRWKDSLIEYSHFKDNGVTSGADDNAADIALFTDYKWDYIAQNGFTDSIESVKRNEIRYNHFSGNSVGFKHKGDQLLTGRNTASPAVDYNDTYDTAGDKIHHNYFEGYKHIAVEARQDFMQVYNNIFLDVTEAISVANQPDGQLYKVVVYNNTIINPKESAIVRYGCNYWSSFTENEEHHGWDYNNLIDSHDKNYNGWFTAVATNLFNGCGGSREPHSNPDISNYFNSNNYFYRPDSADIFNYRGTYYNANEFETQTETGSPRVAFTNSFDAGNPLYAGTTGANKFIPLESHLIEGSKTIANGGIGGDHPYLSGVTIPSYIGAVAPNNSGWVAGVLCLSDTLTLMDGGPDGPGCSKRPKPITTIDATVIRQ